MTERNNLSAKQKLAISKTVRIRSANFNDHLHIKAEGKPNWSLGQRKNKRGTTVTYRGRPTPTNLEI